MEEKILFCSACANTGEVWTFFGTGPAWRPVPCTCACGKGLSTVARVALGTDVIPRRVEHLTRQHLAKEGLLLLSDAIDVFQPVEEVSQLVAPCGRLGKIRIMQTTGAESRIKQLKPYSMVSSMLTRTCDCGGVMRAYPVQLVFICEICRAILPSRIKPKGP